MYEIYVSIPPAEVDDFKEMLTPEFFGNMVAIGMIRIEESKPGDSQCRPSR